MKQQHEAATMDKGLPVSADHNLLSASNLELGSPEGLLCLCSVNRIVSS